MREEILLHRFAGGDKDALNELVGRYYPEILRYCLWHAPNPSLAEDAAQETFLKAVRYISACTFSGQFRPFLYKIAANTCIDMRREKWNSLSFLEEAEQELPYQELGFESIHEEMVLRKIVKDLPGEEQEIVMLRFRQDLKLREIAKIMDMPMRTVQSKLKKSLKQIKAQWET